MIRTIRRRVLERFRPPQKISLSAWAEENIELSSGAVTGPIRLYPFQVDMADAMTDPSLERITILKSARIGYSTLLTSAVASYVANDPADIMLVLPTQTDCRTFAVSQLDPLFEASPNIAGLLSREKAENKKSNMLSRRYAGGSLKIVPAKAPRNLRAHTVRILVLDEIDALTNTTDGDPIALAEERTRTFPDRKIISGSTPVKLSTSLIYQEWLKSDQRIFEVCCPSCSDFREVLWEDMKFEDDAPEAIYWCAPCCGSVVEERHKISMVRRGRWRITKPEVKGHAGFKINSLVSPIANARWGQLAKEYIEKRDIPEKKQTFWNNVLGLPWNDEIDDIDEAEVASRVQPFGIGSIPECVLYLTMGVDVQDDRLEATTVGWDKDGVAYILAHNVIFGSPDETETWSELDDLITARHQHPLGGKIGIDAVAVDSGDGDWTEAVYQFTTPRRNRKVMAIKGMSGAGRRELTKSTSKKNNNLFLVGVEPIKGKIMSRVSRKSGIFFSDSLEAVWFEQLLSEHKVIVRVRNRPQERWERKKGRAAEALDATVYAFAAKNQITASPDQRAAELRQDQAIKTRPRGVDFTWPAAA